MSKNKNINLILKIHPANITKSNFSNNQNNEINSIKNHLGVLPKNLKIIYPDTKINTWLLISLIDICVTVRGTVGIESALCNKHVITAGSGRYDKLGFTKDFDNAKSYLKFLKNIKNKNIMNQNSNFAKKFAFFTFKKRIFLPNTLISKYKINFNDNPEPFFYPKKINSLNFLKDYKDFSYWIKSRNEDYLKM